MKKDQNKDYPILLACPENNTEMIQLLLYYAIKKENTI